MLSDVSFFGDHRDVLAHLADDAFAEALDLEGALLLFVVAVGVLDAVLEFDEGSASMGASDVAGGSTASSSCLLYLLF